jgi:hypothetical protein
MSKEEDNILEFAVSIQTAGKERGKRIYFDSRDIEEIKEECGEDFFLFTERTLLAFVDPSKQRITLTPIKGVHKKLF